MNIKFNKFKSLDVFKNASINKGDVNFIEESKSIVVDGVDYTGLTNVVQTINLYDYQSEDDPIIVNGPFEIYVEATNEDGSKDTYYSSHHRYLAYDDSVVRFDCLVHSMETNKIGKGVIYSMLLKNEDGSWSNNGYFEESLGILNPNLEEKEYEDEDAKNADVQTVSLILRQAFGETNTIPVFVNLFDHLDGQPFSIDGPFLCYYDDGSKKFQSCQHKTTTLSGGYIYRVECFDYTMNADYSTTGRLYAILNFEQSSDKWVIFGWYDVAAQKGYSPDFKTEVDDVYFQGDSDVVLSMFKAREIEALTVKGDGTKFLADDGNYYAVEGSASDNIRYYETRQAWKDDTSRVIPCICYINELNKIVYDDGSPIPEPFVWNFSSDVFSNLGTIASSTEIDGLTLLPNTQITAYRTTINGNDYTHRMYFSQAGSTTTRGVSFALNGNDDIEITYQSGGNKTIFNLVKEDGTIIRTFSGTTAQKITFHYSGDACTAYLYPTGGSGYIYEIKLNI